MSICEIRVNGKYGMKMMVSRMNWLFTSYLRFHYVGLVLLFLHDIGDVLLEFGKTCKYFSELDGKKISIADLLANVVFAVFTLQW